MNITLKKEKSEDSSIAAKELKPKESKRTQYTGVDELFSSAMNEFSDAAIARDIYGYIIDVNKAAIEMYGATDKSDFLGKNILNFAAKNDKGRAANDALKMITSNQGNKSRYHALTKSGEEIQVEITTSIIRDADGEKIGFVNVIKKLIS